MVAVRPASLTTAPATGAGWSIRRALRHLEDWGVADEVLDLFDRVDLPGEGLLKRAFYT